MIFLLLINSFLSRLVRPSGKSAENPVTAATQEENGTSPPEPQLQSNLNLVMMWKMRFRKSIEKEASKAKGLSNVFDLKKSEKEKSKTENSKKKSPVEWNGKAGAPAAGKELIMSPMTLTWTDKGGQQRISVKNTATTPQALKVKCSDNKLFSINPVFTLIPPGKSVNIVVTRTSGPIKVDKVVICYATCTEADEKDLAAFFKKSPLFVVNVELPMRGGAAPRPSAAQSV